MTDEQRQDGGKGEQRGYQSKEHPTTKIATFNFEHLLKVRERVRPRLQRLRKLHDIVRELRPFLGCVG